ncbi:hypothetical protein ACGFY7_00700 [Streptomyces prunicolor]
MAAGSVHRSSARGRALLTGAAALDAYLGRPPAHGDGPSVSATASSATV